MEAEKFTDKIDTFPTSPRKVNLFSVPREAAIAIAERGFHVIQPDFHSNPKTAPGAATPADFALALRDLLAPSF